jgi:AraC-like DNA-binding protein
MAVTTGDPLLTVGRRRESYVPTTVKEGRTMQQLSRGSDQALPQDAAPSVDPSNGPVPKSRIRMKDVAAAAGVSIKTVSRVINGEGQVSPVKRQVVEDAVLRLGYVRNEHAAALRRASNS